jgi:hypothetical protein
MFRKYGNGNWWTNGLSPAELANIYCESWQYDGSAVAKMRDKALAGVVSIIKRQLRQEGKSFITKGGVNPVQQAVDDLTVAFNAPKCAGVKAWFARWVPDYQWADSACMSDAEIAELKEKVMYGDVEFSPLNQKILRFHLGVDEYNKFVKEFNK